MVGGGGGVESDVSVQLRPKLNNLNTGKEDLQCNNNVLKEDIENRNFVQTRKGGGLVGLCQMEEVFMLGDFYLFLGECKLNF